MLEDIVELPINMDNVECVTECWTYNRMIILKTSPYYEDWIASHYNLYAAKNNKNNYRFLFGETHIYTPDYYDDILIRRQIKYFEQTVDGFVDMLKSEIQNGYYINIMLKPFPEKEWTHEIVLYGYNDNEKVFKAVGLEKRIFKKKDYSYTFFENILPLMKEHFQDKQGKGMELSLEFQYPISAFRLREDFCSDGCVFGAFRKIKAELYGEILVKESLKAEGTYEQTATIYRGISCLDALSSYINEILEGKAFDGALVSSIKKLYEHRKMIMVSMKYIQKKWESSIDLNILVDCITTYEQCYLVVEKWVNMALKYELTEKKELLKKILDQIPEVIGKEYRSLNKFTNQCIEWMKFNKKHI